MKNDLKIALLQTHLIWEAPLQNRTLLHQKIEHIKSEVDIIALPEMFSTGFSTTIAFAETIQGETINWMKTLAKHKNAAICGSLMIKEDANVYNRFVFATPKGELFMYNKRHTFSYSGESAVITKGKLKQIINYKNWTICPQICYDLRFPVWSRNTENYEVLLYVANWPESRKLAWDALLKARAIENMCYTVGVNRVGVDGNGIAYSGNSMVYNALGESVVIIPEHEDAIKIVTLSKRHLIENRTKFQFLKDQDDFIIR